MNILTVFDAYVTCALWSSMDEEGEPLDLNYFPTDLSPELVTSMKEDVVDFVKGNKEVLEQSKLSDDQIGHDFWLNRNGHGVGFWDRGLGEIGTKLSEAAEVYSGIDLYVGDDGKIYGG